MKKSILGVACACLSFVSFNVGAVVLEGRLPTTPGGTDYQAWYDPDADLTWLADANYAITSGYDADGFMTWTEANVWATSLSIAGVTGWRLPITVQPDTGCTRLLNGITWGDNCLGSEMVNLYHNVLGGAFFSSLTANHNSNYDLFSNYSTGPYWSQTELSIDTAGAYIVSMDSGQLSWSGKTSTFSGWAVHSGDVSEVLLPAAAWLFASSLIGLIGFSRRKACS